MIAHRKEGPMRPLLLVLVLVLAGRAHVPVESAASGSKLLSATPDIDSIQFQTTDNLNRATVTDSGARGPFIDLKREPGRIQGTVRVDLPVDLQRKGNGIVGRFAGDAYDLTLMPDGKKTRVIGLIHGQPTTFWLSPQKIAGRSANAGSTSSGGPGATPGRGPAGRWDRRT
jgi:hypothetical protein